MELQDITDNNLCAWCHLQDIRIHPQSLPIVLRTNAHSLRSSSSTQIRSGLNFLNLKSLSLRPLLNFHEVLLVPQLQFVRPFFPQAK